MMTGSMVSDPRQSYLKNRPARWGDPAHVEPRTLYLNEIDPPIHFSLQNKPNYINVQYRTVLLDTAECFPRSLTVGSARRHPQKPP